MTLDRVLSILGLVSGIPGFALLFFQQQVVVGILCLLIAVLCVGFLLRTKYITTQPAFVMDSVSVTLKIADKAGKAATLCKQYQIRPKYPHLSQMSHRNIAADGTIKNLQWDGEAIPPHSIKEVLGEYQITLQFPTPLEREKPFAGTLTYDVVDSFPNADEGLVYVVDFPCKSVDIAIELPQDRPCMSATAWQVRGAGKTALKKGPQINRTNTEIRVQLKKPPVGAEYEVWWKW